MVYDLPTFVPAANERSNRTAFSCRDMISIIDEELRGPFGLAIAGTQLPGGPPVQTPIPPTFLLLGGSFIGLFALKKRLGY